MRASMCRKNVRDLNKSGTHIIYIYIWPSIKQFVLFAGNVLKNSAKSKSIIVLGHFSYHAAH